MQGLTLPFIFTVTIAYIGEETAGAASVRLAATYMSGAIFGGFAGRAIPGLVAQFWGWRVSLLLIALITLAMAGGHRPLPAGGAELYPGHGTGAARSARFPRHLRNRRLLANNFIGFGVLFCLIGVFTYVQLPAGGAALFARPGSTRRDFRGLSRRGRRQPAGGAAGGAVRPTPE